MTDLSTLYERYRYTLLEEAGLFRGDFLKTVHDFWVAFSWLHVTTFELYFGRKVLDYFYSLNFLIKIFEYLKKKIILD